MPAIPWRKRRRRAAGAAVLVVAAVLLGVSAFSQTAVEGKVVAIADGDTLTVLLPDRTQKRVRLAGIDAPETGQPLGKESKQALAGMVFGATVRVRVVDTDRYGRWVGDVYADGTHVNTELVRQGYAWVYRQYARNAELFAAEDEARSARRGIWRLPESQRIPPWEWRRISRKP